MVRKGILTSLIALSTIFAVGCWDRVEIEKNAFILGLGIDLEEDNSLNITYQVALLDSFKGEKGEKSKSTQQISIKSNSLSESRDALLKHFGDTPNLSHCKLIVFGEEYARNGIKSSLDYLFREPDIRRITSVCVAKGRAKEVLDSEPQTAPSSAMVIDQIVTQNSANNSGIFPFPDIGYLHRNFIRESDVALVGINAGKDTVEVSGAGIFKDYKLVGWFSDSEVIGQRFILGEVHKGLLTADLSYEMGDRLTLNAYNINVRTIPKIKDGKIKIETKVFIEGDINEVGNPTTKLDTKTLLEFWGKAVENKIRDTVDAAYKKGRDTYGVDCFEIDEKIEGYYPKFWKEHGKEWNELFKTADLDLEIKVKIRRVGLIEP
ncbi:MAG TPA: Ger(x)C family spore germination protein [Clostridia bacterium]|nr:Ger(x)C family spore germination protein [Clostridia bacterium]